jgi:hypothetical protein
VITIGTAMVNKLTVRKESCRGARNRPCLAVFSGAGIEQFRQHKPPLTSPPSSSYSW